MSKANFTIAYFLALPMTVLSLSVNLYRVSNHWRTTLHLPPAADQAEQLNAFSASCIAQTHIYVYIPYPLLQSPSVQLSRLITTDEYHEIIHIFLFVVGHFWHLFFCNYLGQKVIDHSGDVFHRMWVIQRGEISKFSNEPQRISFNSLQFCWSGGKNDVKKKSRQVFKKLLYSSRLVIENLRRSQYTY